MTPHRSSCATRPSRSSGRSGRGPRAAPALEDLAAELYARGLSARDIEDTVTGEDGKRLPSRAAVSEVTERLRDEYEACCTGDLAEPGIVSLDVDGSGGPARFFHQRFDLDRERGPWVRQARDPDRRS